MRSTLIIITLAVLGLALSALFQGGSPLLLEGIMSGF